jgi:hypothetical protein
MEPQTYAAQMQKEMMNEIEAAHPKYVVFVSVFTSWLARTPQEKILTWSDRYLRECYSLTGTADIYSQNDTAMLWDAEATAYKPRSMNVVYTFRRNSDAPCVAARQ